jgi:hypothetical protein
MVRRYPIDRARRQQRKRDRLQALYFGLMMATWLGAGLVLIALAVWGC